MNVCPRHIKWNGWCAQPILPDRNVCTALRGGTTMAKTAVYELLETAHTLYPLAHTDQ